MTRLLAPPLFLDGLWGTVARVIGTPAPLEVHRPPLERRSSRPAGALATFECGRVPHGSSLKRELRGGERVWSPLSTRGAEQTPL